MPKAKSHASTTKRQRWTRGQARAVLEKQASSGLTVREFAEREGLKPVRLQRWRERLGVGTEQRLAASAASMPERAAFVEVRAQRPVGSASPMRRSPTLAAERPVLAWVFLVFALLSVALLTCSLNLLPRSP